MVSSIQINNNNGKAFVCVLAISLNILFNAEEKRTVEKQTRWEEDRRERKQRGGERIEKNRNRQLEKQTEEGGIGNRLLRSGSIVWREQKREGKDSFCEILEKVRRDERQNNSNRTKKWQQHTQKTSLLELSTILTHYLHTE